MHLLFSYVASTGVLLIFLVNLSFNNLSILVSLSTTSCLNSDFITHILIQRLKFYIKTFILELFVVKVLLGKQTKKALAYVVLLHTQGHRGRLYLPRHYLM